MSGDNFSAQNVRVGDQSNFRQGHDFHAPVTIVNNRLYERTALHDAVSRNNESEAERLLNDGADINALDPGGYTPINIAIWNGHEAMVKFLLDKGAPVENLGATLPPLHAAILNGNRNLVELLLDRGADKEKRSGGHQTPLSLATSKGENEIAAFLIQRGVSVNARTITGKTSISGAVTAKNAETVRLLLQNGAVPTQSDYSGAFWTIIKNSEELTSAFRTYGNSDIQARLNAGERDGSVRRIKASGFDVNNLKERDAALLYYVKIRRDTEVKVLLNLGAGFTAMEYEKDATWHAVRIGSEKMVQMLLDRGADARRVYPPGKETLLHIAIPHRNVTLIQMILACGADIEAKDSGGYTPLHHAAMFSCGSIATLLLDHGAKMDVKDNGGCTPFNRATYARSEDVIRVLRARGAN